MNKNNSSGFINKKDIDDWFSIIDTGYRKHKQPHKEHPLNQLTDYQLYHSENDIIHTPYEFEKAQLKAISDGDLDTYIKLSQPLEGYSIGQLAGSYAKSLEYQIVIGVSLYARAAIEGGVAPILAYDLNDLLLQQIAICETPDDYARVMEYAVNTYIDAVNHAKAEKEKSVYITKAKDYIIRHLNKPFSVTELAENIGIDKAYLMRLFKKHENMTILEYLNREKVNAAKNMLTFSDYSIEDIAFYLQFSSQSHFGAVFKKIAGTTPLKYRNNNMRGM